MNYRIKTLWVAVLLSLPFASSETMEDNNGGRASIPLVNPDDASINAFQIMHTSTWNLRGDHISSEGHADADRLIEQLGQPNA